MSESLAKSNNIIVHGYRQVFIYTPHEFLQLGPSKLDDLLIRDKFL